MKELTQPDEIREVLTQAHTVAVIGAHHEAKRASFYVPDYLAAHGYRILPVNVRLTDQTLWGQPVRGNLTDLGEPVDVVDVFRKSEDVPGHLEEILAMQPRPKVVWLQQGIRNDAVAAKLLAVGIKVVQDRCMLAEHRALGVKR